YPHLEYSTAKDAAYCFVCSLFPDVAGRQKSKGYWNEIGVTGWKKMKGSSGLNKMGKLQKHFTSKAHKSALTDYCNYMKKSNNIDVMLDKTVRERKIQEESNQSFHKEVICILLDVTKTLARQGLAFRGKDDDENGNFRQITYLLSRHCPLLKKWLDDSCYRPYHSTYLSPQSQNEFITILASSVNKIIRAKVRESGQFSVMADTTPDLSHTDRLSVVVRFVNNEGTAEEILIEVRESLNKTGVGMANDILDSLQKNELDPDNFVFQSYDFASSMSGVFNGAQQKLTEILGRKIPYIPCQAHRINTFIEHGCEATDIEIALKLRNLSKTRWTARAEAIKSVWSSFNIIIEVLDEITNTNDKFDKSTRNAANSLSKRLISVDFVVSILFMKNVMYKIKLLTECLESTELNIADAIIFLSSTLESLNIINSDIDGMDNLINSSIAFLKSFDVDAEKEFIVRHRRRLVPKRLDNNRDNAANISFKTFYRKEYKSVLDELTSLMKNNLESCIGTIKPLYNMFKPPVSRNNLSETGIQDAMSFLPKQFLVVPLHLQVELEVLYDQCKEVETVSDVAAVSEQTNKMLPIANRMCRLLCTAPVTVAGNERSFSKLKLIKNYLRTTQSDSRLSDLLLLST
ncbi:52 kDa repressor of the inhibitor of the protein kinase-like, partial [Aphis craccivora]